MNKFIALTVVGLFLIGCKTLPQGQNSTENPDDNNITLKFVQVNDVYEIAPLNGGEYGGMARVAHIRDSIKNKFPNTYLFMAGDFLNPSLLGTLKVDGERLYGKQMVDVMNAMNFDLVTFGNHEFDLSEKNLQKRINESNFSWTSANVRQVTDAGIDLFSKKDAVTEVAISPMTVSDFANFQIKDSDGKSMTFGIVGVCIASNPQAFVYYGDIYEEVDRAYKEAQKVNDVVFGLTHVKIEQDEEIAKLLPSIPLIMGGHDHNAMLVKVGETAIAKADSNAKSLYVHTILFNTLTKKCEVKSELVFVDEKIASNLKVEKIVEKYNQLLETQLKEVIANPDEIIYNPIIPLDGTDSASRSIQTNLGYLIARSMAYSFDDTVDGALVNGGSIRVDDQLEGPITATDIFRVLPFGGSVLKVELKGKLLLDILDFGEEKRGEGAYLQRYNISQSKEGEWTLQGKLIEDTVNYKIAFSDYLLKGLDIPFLTAENKEIISVLTPKENETAADIRKAIIFYLNSLKK